MKDFRSPELYTVVLYQPDKKQWLSFEKPSEILSTLHPSDILPVLNEVEHRCRDGRYAAGFVSYEAATCFESAIPVCENYKFPLLWFGIYDKPVIYSKPETSSINQPLTWNSSISETEYVLLINKIKDYIRHGDTYQVNFSFDLITGFNSDLFDFFNYLSDIHPSPYSAYINLDNFSIASFSPELFFSLKEGTITCRPMKGTIKRGKTCIEDTRNSQMLFNSAKNRAENIMIVDMIRNDLGRIAKTGTVRVEELFQIEKYKTIFQMTSTISAQTDKSIVEIFKALFPCASITGAPKIRTSQIINELEDRPRGIYCGSIGYITPQKDVQFNVAIRTITLDKLNNSATYNVGSGIVWDSDPLDEYRECLAKAHIL
ncbi:MAG: aminodeoxychorismate synthase component I, partial [Fibrobacter sp.]|nr:aminodeoxychorismate synthase component I [Fibrobacter sp.]